ncbi:LarC family nickel insertion protein [Peribacillus saganii]|uniref:LarC family nickel insertion protein n=1 Tax=Peribacillus saganii TaxID=2303992 RepID=A0A372LPT7_9BACI|nr:LarC family nickel insertion protein [Peribacillus saganii]RFU70130.1 LarC family nickel insertion protein [Peribacillus saganii]
MRLLYLDCFSGISGDMMVGALIDAGASPEHIEQELKKIPVSGYALNWSRVVKQGISATKFDVTLDDQEEVDHDHDHHDHNHHHHHHGSEVSHSHHAHSHYSDILRMIEESALDEKVKERSKEIFAPIAASEAKIHNIPLESVHFHEVGAIDSIVDIVAAAIALEELEIDKIVSSPVPLGSGHIHCAHGVYPVPAPATLDMLVNVPIAQSSLKYELTTPTGAGIIASQAESFGPLPSMTVTAVGYGAGTRDIPGKPNVLRVVVGEAK